MNQFMQEYYPTFEMYQALRNQLMEILSDEDLSFTPDGNPSLGTLCREMGEVEHSYIQSFKEFTQNFSFRADDPELEGSVEKLSDWYAKLDAELKEVISGFSDEEIHSKIVDRGEEFKIPVRIQLEIYKEALLIFYGKVSVYLKMLGKELPRQWQHWIE